MHTTFKGEERPHPTIKRCAKVITGIEKIAALHKGKKPYVSVLTHGIKATFNVPLRYEKKKKKKRVGAGDSASNFHLPDENKGVTTRRGCQVVASHSAPVYVATTSSQSE